MGLLTGLPMPKITTGADAAAEQTGSGMRNFLSLFSMVQGGQSDAVKAKAATEQAAAKQASQEAGQARIREAFQFANTTNDRLNVLNQNPGLLIHPDTAPILKGYLNAEEQMAKVRQGVQAAKVKVTETHFVNRFNDDLNILASENPEAFAAISMKRPDPNVMPDMEMVGVVSQAKQSFLQKQAAEKEALKNKSINVTPFDVTLPGTGQHVRGVQGGGSFRVTTEQVNPEVKIDSAKLAELNKLDTSYADQQAKLQRKYASEQALLKSGQSETDKMKSYSAELNTLNRQRNDLQSQIQTFKSPAATAAPAVSSGIPAVGEVRQGYKFKGGDPADRNSWEPVQ